MSQPDPTTSARSHLILLPAELRQQIWDILYTEITRPDVLWERIEDSEEVLITSFIIVEPALVCRYLCAEILATIWRHATIHIVYPEYVLPRHNELPRPRITERFRHVVWHFNQFGWRDYEYYHLPSAALLMRNFPNLETFTMREPLALFVDGLSFAEDVFPADDDAEIFERQIQDSATARAKYKNLSTTERISAMRKKSWFNASEFLLKAKTAHNANPPGLQVWLERFKSGISPTWDRGEPLDEGRREELVAFTSRVQIYLEVEIWLMYHARLHGCDFGLAVKEPMVVKVDCRRCMITDVRELSTDEGIDWVVNGFTSYRDGGPDYASIEESRAISTRAHTSKRATKNWR